MPNKAANVVARSLTISGTPRREQRRRNELLAIDFAPKRLTALALHSMAVHHPKFAARLFGVETRPDPVPVIGAGRESVVYRVSSDEVVKVHTTTLGLSAAEQGADAKALHERHLIMMGYLGSFSLKQQSIVGRHPIYTGVPVVTTHQAYRGIVSPRLFAGTENEVNERSWRHMRTQAPDAAKALVQLATAALDCFHETSVMPDVAGRNNLVLATGDNSLVLIDGHPIREANTPAIERSHTRLQNLAMLTF